MHFIRSGDCATQETEGYIAQQDISLSPLGEATLTQLKEKFEYPRVDVVYTSPMLRAKQSADILYPENQIITLDAFKDMDLGEFSGKPFKQLKDDPDFALWVSRPSEHFPPGGEDNVTFNTRLINGVSQLFTEMMDQRLTNVAVITHGVVVASVMALMGVPKGTPEDWNTPHGTGFTLMITPQLWMRENVGEVLARIPALRAEEG